MPLFRIIPDNFISGKNNSNFTNNFTLNFKGLGIVRNTLEHNIILNQI